MKFYAAFEAAELAKKFEEYLKSGSGPGFARRHFGIYYTLNTFRGERVQSLTVRKGHNQFMNKPRRICRASLTVIVCAALGVTMPLRAQDPIVTGASPVAPFSADTLEQILKPIALYPDPLLAEIFTAATVPAQIVMADRYINGGGDLTQIAAQPWDDSVKALAHYPTVLKWLDDNIDWTTEVGQAYLNQPDEVSAAVQHLRYLAQAEGNLASTPQENVVNDGGTIEIDPVDPNLLYVPAYPWDTIYSDPGIYCTFGVGFPIGIWLTHDWDWRHHRIFGWDPHHPRPGNWWTRAPRDRVPPRGVVAWHGSGGAPRAIARNVDRGWADSFRPPQVAPPAMPVRPNAGRVGVTPPVSRPGTVPGFQNEFRTPTMGGGFAGSLRVPATPPPDISHAEPPMRGAPGGPAVANPGFGGSYSGAFGGSQSSSDARQSSARGAESRSAVSSPAPAANPGRSYSTPASSSGSSGSSSGGESHSGRGR